SGRRAWCPTRRPRRQRPLEVRTPASFHPFPVRVLDDDLAVPQRPQVAATDFEPLAVRRRPGQGPLGDTAIAVDAQEVSIVAVMDVRNALEPLREARPHRLAALVAGPPPVGA